MSLLHGGEAGAESRLVASGSPFSMSSLGRQCRLLCMEVPHWLVGPPSVPPVEKVQTAEVRRLAGLLALKLPRWTKPSCTLSSRL